MRNGRYDENGSVVWYKNGKKHREDGPACIWSDGSKAWYLNGKLHREDGPAVEMANGLNFFYLGGKLLNEEEFEFFLERRILNDHLRSDLPNKRHGNKKNKI